MIYSDSIANNEAMVVQEQLLAAASVLNPPVLAAPLPSSIMWNHPYVMRITPVWCGGPQSYPSYLHKL